MEKTFKKLQEVSKRLNECEKEKEALQGLPFYKLFKQEAQQAADKQALDNRIAGLMAARAMRLEQLRQKVVMAQLETEYKYNKATALNIVA